MKYFFINKHQIGFKKENFKHFINFYLSYGFRKKKQLFYAVSNNYNFILKNQ